MSLAQLYEWSIERIAYSFDREPENFRELVFVDSDVAKSGFEVAATGKAKTLSLSLSLSNEDPGHAERFLSTTQLAHHYGRV